MFNMVRADLFKMFKSSTVKVLFAITTLCSIIMVIMAYSIQHGKLGTQMTAIGFMISDADIISILGAVIAGVFICSDFENKTIHEAITCGCSRGAIVFSKIISFFICLWIILLPYVVAAVIALCTGYKFSMGSVGIGFLNLIVKEAGTFSASKATKLLVIILALILVYAAQLSLCIPFAFLFKKPAMVIAVYYATSFASAQLLSIKTKSKTFENIFACTPYGGKNQFITLHSASGDITKAIVCSLVFIIIMIGLTYTMFRRDEIK